METWHICPCVLGTHLLAVEKCLAMSNRPPRISLIRCCTYWLTLTGSPPSLKCSSNPFLKKIGWSAFLRPILNVKWSVYSLSYSSSSVWKNIRTWWVLNLPKTILTSEQTLDPIIVMTKNMLIPTNAPTVAVLGGRGIALTWFLLWHITWCHLGWEPQRIARSESNSVPGVCPSLESYQALREH